MPKYELLTKYILELEHDKIGEWVVDKVNDGTTEHPIHMPYVNYSTLVEEFRDDFQRVVSVNEDLGLNRYNEILAENGIQWEGKSMKNADVSTMSEKCVLALIMGAIRAERFYDGALLEFFQSRTILKWLERLKAIDDAVV